MHPKKIKKNCCTLCVLQLGLWCEDAQTKHIRLCPWCGDDAYALGWGVLTIQAMVGAKATLRHGCGEKQKKVFAQEAAIFLVQFYIGYDRTGCHAQNYILN
jgi:hypothetical protein